MSNQLTPTGVTVRVNLLTETQRARAHSVVLHVLKQLVIDIEQYGLNMARGLPLTDPDHNPVGSVEVAYFDLSKFCSPSGRYVQESD